MLLGFDIGGTKCGVVTGDRERIFRAEKIPTERERKPEEILSELSELAEKLLDGEKPEAIGVSCGGPLDSARGVILSPPNLPGWDEVPVTEILEKRFGAKAKLQNDANASALAEWRYGAGRGSRNMIFLTFGTGLGAGLILDGRLYAGTNDMAGEAGHISLSEFGPAGYGKIGSFEGFCSGGGLAQLGRTYAEKALGCGIRPAYYPEDGDLLKITAKSVAEAAFAGDETALEVYGVCGTMLGRGLAVLVDLLNPEMIVLGSIFARSGALLRERMEKEMKKRALARSLAVCRV
ncbi:MAG: ROK family protein, partial [Clostridia bacterium]|nr:ROK family protein [Clostridia bacterium]